MRLRTILLCFLSILFIFIIQDLYKDKQTKHKYPSKPITIIVHVNPGSGVDIMARKVADIARKDFNVIMTVENMLGTQGLRSMQHVLNQPRDGYTLLSVTTGFLSTLILNQSSVDIDDFIFVGLMLEDAEALIVNKKSDINDFDAIIAKSKTWIGPGVGGRDHLMAIKSWEKFGLEHTKWISYSTGPQSVLALMRKEGDVYVGNAMDIRGKTHELSIAAVSSPKRLEAFPDVPTFTELGYPMQEYMWRGFAFAKNTPKEKVIFMENLLFQISQTEEWQKYIKSLYCFPGFKGHKEFQEMVHAEKKETLRLLKKANLINTYSKTSNSFLIMTGLSLFLITTLLLITLKIFFKKHLTQTIWICAYLIATSFFFLFQAYNFNIPQNLNITHPGTVPTIWSISIIIICTILILKNKTESLNKNTNTYKTFLAIILVVTYFILIFTIGYYLSSLIFVFSLSLLLGHKSVLSALNFAIFYVISSYLLFYSLLNVRLPLGVLLS